MRLGLFTTAAALALTGCATTLPVGRVVDVDPDTAPSCLRVCKAVGMRVAAIVFIRNMGGCVCEPGAGSAGADAKGTASPRAEVGQGGASAAQMGGAILVMLEEEAAQQQHQQQQQQQSRSSSSWGPTGPVHH